MSTYPEHEKMAAIRDKSQAIGEFIEWLHLLGWHIAEFQAVGGLEERLWMVHKSTNELLALHFGIDLNKVEQEKRAMLDEIRAAQR